VKNLGIVFFADYFLALPIFALFFALFLAVRANVRITFLAQDRLHLPNFFDEASHE